MIGDAVATVGAVMPGGRQTHRHRAAGLTAEEGCPGRDSRVKYSRMLSSSFSLRQDQGLLHLPWLSAGSGDLSGQPGLQFRHRPGEVHGAIRVDGTPGSSSGAGPTLTRLVERIPRRWVCTHRQWRPCRPSPYPCKEAGEARVDVLGRDLGTAETGACSAAPAGEAETPTQSGSGCSAGSGSRGGLERGSAWCSRVRFPGRSRLELLGRRRGRDRVLRDG